MSDFPLEPCCFCGVPTSSGRSARMSAPKVLNPDAPLRTVCSNCAIDWVVFEKIGENDYTETFIARPMGILT